MALLIKTFLETAADPKFRHNLLHEIMYRFHILGETSLPDPGFTPYYDREFFSVLLSYQEKSNMNIIALTIKQWYQMLLADTVLMSPATDNSPQVLLPVRTEILHPNTDWPFS